MEQQQTKMKGKVRYSRVTEEIENRVKKLREEGMTIRKISQRLNLSSSKISRILYKCIFLFFISVFLFSFISAYLPSNVNEITNWGRSVDWFAPTNTTPTISDNSQYLNPSQTQNAIQESNLTAEEKETQRLYNNYLIEQMQNNSKPMNFTTFKRSIAPPEPLDLLVVWYFVTPVILIIIFIIGWKLYHSRTSDV